MRGDERQRFYQRIGAQHMAPLWEVLHALVPPQPATPMRPALWRHADWKPAVTEAGALITAREAERRVLILENPAAPGQSRITNTLYAGLQLILPGELAPAHRHTQSALRLVLDGEGAYTAVDGQRTTMRRGDFIVTPSWTWHEHGNDGGAPVVWLDGLDIPMVQFFDAGFAQKAEAEAAAPPTQPPLRPEGDALARYGSGMVPIDDDAVPSGPSTSWVWPFARTRAALRAVASATPDPHHGHKMRFVDPATGASPMPTIGTFAQLLPAGFETRALRSTDGTVMTCLEGAGQAQIGEATFDFSENDVFVVPSWHLLRLRATRETVLFGFSDRPVQRALGLWREDKPR